MIIADLGKVTHWKKLCPEMNYTLGGVTSYTLGRAMEELHPRRSYRVGGVTPKRIYVMGKFIPGRCYTGKS